tara:strand:- start:648 stop:890 length:243 start_codon:yes stop_codon:yes gene_type:complete
MNEVHHTVETLFIMVISMWGFDGNEWQYIGNQISLQQPMTQAQCEYLIDEDMWQVTYENHFYRMMAHCFPTDCAGKDKCE